MKNIQEVFSNNALRAGAVLAAPLASVALAACSPADKGTENASSNINYSQKINQDCSQTPYTDSQFEQSIDGNGTNLMEAVPSVVPKKGPQESQLAFSSNNEHTVGEQIAKNIARSIPAMAVIYTKIEQPNTRIVINDVASVSTSTAVNMFNSKLEEKEDCKAVVSGFVYTPDVHEFQSATGKISEFRPQYINGKFDGFNVKVTQQTGPIEGISIGIAGGDNNQSTATAKEISDEYIVTPQGQIIEATWLTNGDEKIAKTGQPVSVSNNHPQISKSSSSESSSSKTTGTSITISNQGTSGKTLAKGYASNSSSSSRSSTSSNGGSNKTSKKNSNGANNQQNSTGSGNKGGGKTNGIESTPAPTSPTTTPNSTTPAGISTPEGSTTPGGTTTPEGSTTPGATTTPERTTTNVNTTPVNTTPAETQTTATTATTSTVATTSSTSTTSTTPQYSKTNPVNGDPDN